MPEAANSRCRLGRTRLSHHRHAPRHERSFISPSCKRSPSRGAVIVSTPQEVALADARKGIDMYRNEKVNVPILGLVENMAWFTPAELPNNRYYIFGREGATRLAEELGVPVLAQIPIVQSICDGGDSGEPAHSAPKPSRDRLSPISPSAVAEATERRNRELDPTKIVEITVKSAKDME